MCILLILSFLPSALFAYQHSGHVQAHSQNVAIVYVDHQEVKRFYLTDDMEQDVFEIHHSPTDSNIIEAKKGQIRMKSATCSDQVCVRMGSISKPGQTIVCLPHKILIEIQSESGEADDVIISS